MTSAKFGKKEISEWATCQISCRLAMGDMPMGVPTPKRNSQSCLQIFKGHSVDGKSTISLIDLYQQEPLDTTREYTCDKMYSEVDDVATITDETKEEIKQGIDILKQGDYTSAYNKFCAIAKNNESLYEAQNIKLNHSKILMPEPATTSEMQDEGRQL